MMVIEQHNVLQLDGIFYHTKRINQWETSTLWPMVNWINHKKIALKMNVCYYNSITNAIKRSVIG